MNKRGMKKLDLWGSVLLVVLVVIGASMIIGFKTTNDNINSLAKVTAAQSPSSQLQLAPRGPSLREDTGGPESYFLRATSFSHDSSTGVNKTNIEKNVNGQWVKVCTERATGSICPIGNVVLTLNYVEAVPVKWVNFSINNDGNFNETYDNSGFKVILPAEEAFPTSVYTFQILGKNTYNQTVLVEDYTYGWETDGDIILLDSNTYLNSTNFFIPGIGESLYGVSYQHVFFNASIKDSDVNIPMIFGKEVPNAQFTGLGKNPGSKTVTSYTHNLIYNYTGGDRGFVASWSQ